MNLDEFYTVRELADIMGVTQPRIVQMQRDDVLPPSVVIHRRHYFAKDAIKRFFNRRDLLEKLKLLMRKRVDTVTLSADSFDIQRSDDGAEYTVSLK